MRTALGTPFGFRDGKFPWKFDIFSFPISRKILTGILENQRVFLANIGRKKAYFSYKSACQPQLIAT